MGILTLILSWFGGGPLGSILGALNKAYADKLNAKSVEDKIAADERIATLSATLADMQGARQNASNLPWWMAIIAFMIGFPFGLHVFAIGMGTVFQPLIVDGWLGSWLLHVPPFPPPFDTQEANVIGFFYGFGAAVVIGGGVVNAVRAHVAARPTK